MKEPIKKSGFILQLSMTISLPFYGKLIRMHNKKITFKSMSTPIQPTSFD